MARKLLSYSFTCLPSNPPLFTSSSKFSNLRNWSTFAHYDRNEIKLMILLPSMFNNLH
jgi:hypothetical protein